MGDDLEKPEEEPAQDTSAETQEEPEPEAQEPEAEEPPPGEEEPEGEAPREGAAVLAHDGRSDFKILVAEDAPEPEAFAAGELARYIEALSGASLPVVHEAEEGDKVIVVGGLTPEEMDAEGVFADGFVIDPTPDRVRIFGGEGRGTLFGVYALLETLGCLWPIPGEGYEFVPKRGLLQVGPDRMAENPRFMVRALAEDSSFINHDDEQQREARILDDVLLIDWMAKNRLNRFFVGGPDDVLELLLSEMARRGIEWETGGHIIPDLLPRDLFEERPGLFRMTTKGERDPSGNLCPSNEDTIEIVKENAVKYAEAHGAAKMIHVWGEDVLEGGWCCCELCREVLPQDQYMRVCNAIAEALADRDVDLDYIAYHDTLEPELTVEPDERLILLFAPRERSYGQFINDFGSDRNRTYANAFRKYADIFKGQVQIFEYYNDPILFGGVAVPLQHVIADDLGFYEEMGATRVEALTFGRYSWWAYPLNLFAYARAAWDVSANIDDITWQFCNAVYGEAASPMAALYDEFEAGLAKVVTYGDLKYPDRTDVSAQSIRDGATAASEHLNGVRKLLREARSVAEGTDAEEEVNRFREAWIFTMGELDGIAAAADALRERAAASRAEGNLLADYLRATHAKFADAISIFRGGLDVMRDIPEEMKGPWGTHGFVRYQEALIAHLEALAQEALDAIPAEPEPEKPKEAPQEEEAVAEEVEEADEGEDETEVVEPEAGEGEAEEAAQ
ncbi:MAG: DUF4838 domain-containing protein [Armatimonadota bacterium]